MKSFFLVLLCLVCQLVSAQEWKSLKAYQNETKQETLVEGQWLTKDRKQNTMSWKNANSYNLAHLRSESYVTVEQRLGFYNWMQRELKQKGHEIYWVAMAAFISDKLNYINVFPYKYFMRTSTIQNTNYGSAVVFNNAMPYLRPILEAQVVLTDETAVTWDLEMLCREQYYWVESVYKDMDSKSLNQISKIAKGKGIYGVFVPNTLEFTGDLEKAEDRYDYAVNVLLPYCKSFN